MASQQGIRAGKAFVELYANDTKLVRGLRSAQRKLKRFGSIVSGMGAKLAGVASLVAAPLAFTVKASSRMEEVMNKFNVVFGDNSKAVKEWSDGFANDVGRSKRQIAEFMAGSQDLFVPLGFEPGAATEMSKQITGLAVDLASFNNMADGDTLRDLHAALTGSGEVMKKYGVIVSEAAVKQELLQQGMDPKAATDQQKVMARLSIIMRGTTAAQGDALRSADSYANQLKRLTAVVENVSGVIGNAFRPVLASLFGRMSDLISEAGKWISRNQELVKMIGIITAVVGAAGAALLALGAAAAIASFAIGGLASILSFALSPVGLAVAAIAGLIAALLKFTNIGSSAIEFMKTNFGGLFKTAQAAIAGIKDALMNGDLAGAASILWKSLEIAWMTGINKLNEVVSGWKTYFLEMWNGTIDTASKFFIDTMSGLQKAWTVTTQFFGDAWDTVVNKIQKVWATVGGSIIDGIDSILDYIKLIHPALAKALPDSGEFRVMAKQATGANLTSGQIDDATNASIASRSAATQEELNAIAQGQSGARSSIDQMAQNRRDGYAEQSRIARSKAERELLAAQEELANAIKGASETAVASTTQNEMANKVANAAAKAATSPAINAAKYGDNSSTLRGVVAAWNQSTANKKLEEIGMGTNSLLAEAVTIWKDNRIPTVEAT